MLLAVVASGDGIWTIPWENRPDAPPTKLSDLGEVRFLFHTRVATLDAKLEARLEQVRTKMTFGCLPENVLLQKEKIPTTLVEAANYLDYNVCMAYPPVLCVEADDAFFFSGGRSTGPVYDFDSGMAIMKADGSIWVWTRVDGDEPVPAGGPSENPAGATEFDGGAR